MSSGLSLHLEQQVGLAGLQRFVHVTAILQGQRRPVQRGAQPLRQVRTQQAGEIDYEGAPASIDWGDNCDLRRGQVGIWRFTADERIEETGTVAFARWPGRASLCSAGHGIDGS